MNILYEIFSNQNTKQEHYHKFMKNWNKRKEETTPLTSRNIFRLNYYKYEIFCNQMKKQTKEIQKKFITSLVLYSLIIKIW